MNPRAKGRANRQRGVRTGIELPSTYKPTESEPFMNERQREYFRRKRKRWKEEFLRQSRGQNL